VSLLLARHGARVCARLALLIPLLDLRGTRTAGEGLGDGRISESVLIIEQ
jgi:hypothetical protein